MKKRKLIPFSWLPAAWGLAGRTRKIAEAEYYFEGSALRERLLEIEAEFSEDNTELEIYQIEREHREGKISENEMYKRIATLRSEPYVNVLNINVDPENPAAGMMELDWNEDFVKYLSGQGFTGTSDEDVVNKWFNLLCRTVIRQEQADQDYGLVNTESDWLNGKESR